MRSTVGIISLCVLVVLGLAFFEPRTDDGSPVDPPRRVFQYSSTH
jgi:hypothetical protein